MVLTNGRPAGRPGQHDFHPHTYIYDSIRSTHARATSKQKEKLNEHLKKEIAVSYSGVIPNLFSEGKGVVAEGKLKDKKYFIADTILAKHDENYMPPEVKEALDKANY